MPTTIILVIALASCDICCKSSQSSVCRIVSNKHMSGNKGLDDISSVLLLQMEALQFPGFSPAFVDPVLRKAWPNKKDLATPLVFACVASDRSLSPVFYRPPPGPPHPPWQASALSQYLHTSPFVTTGGQASFLQRTIIITAGIS